MNSKRLGLIMAVVPYSILVLGLAYFEAVDRYSHTYRVFGHADYLADAFGPAFIVLMLGFFIGAFASMLATAFRKAWLG